jgi:hypothetical protein
MLPLSPALSEILGIHRAMKFGKPIKLKPLCRQISLKLGPAGEPARSLLNALGMMTRGQILRHLAQIASHDSVTRDILTVGHLAKLLSRTDLIKDGNYNLAALPNPIFDRMSMADRDAYFKSGHSLHIIASKDQLVRAREVLSREAIVLAEGENGPII